MKVSIITMHAMHNPGSVFQAFALQDYIGKQGHNVEIIDYCPDYFYTEGNGLKYWAKRLLYFRAYESLKNKFSSFIKNNMNLTKRFVSYNELENQQFGSDVYIVGSDQLWNTDFECGKDLAYYLKFLKQGKKVSYSTSIGKLNIDDYNKEILIQNLKDFDDISVRELSSSIQLSEILGKKVKWVCDPVFLLSKMDYKKFIYDSPLKEPYVMVYISPKSDKLDKIVDYYHQKGVKVVLLGGFTKRCYCDMHIMDAGPYEFLTFIYNAQTVISSSFHATAFCHIFHKNFITIVPERNGERIMSLLKKTDLQGKAITSEHISFEELEKEIDWNLVDKELDEYVDSSKQYLQDVLS